MKLVYEGGTTEVELGDPVLVGQRESGVVERIDKPWKPSSTGRVGIRMDGSGHYREFFPNVIKARWIDREDQK